MTPLWIEAVQKEIFLAEYSILGNTSFVLITDTKFNYQYIRDLQLKYLIINVFKHARLIFNKFYINKVLYAAQLYMFHL